MTTEKTAEEIQIQSYALTLKRHARAKKRDVKRTFMMFASFFVK